MLDSIDRNVFIKAYKVRRQRSLQALTDIGWNIVSILSKLRFILIIPVQLLL